MCVYTLEKVARGMGGVGNNYNIREKRKVELRGGQKERRKGNDLSMRKVMGEV